MAKNKKGKNGGKGKTNSRQHPPQRPSRTTNSRGASGAYSHPDNPEQATFTLRDAARNSAHPASYFSNSTTNLRYQTMNFVRGEELVQEDLAKIPRYVEASPQVQPNDHVNASDQDGANDEEDEEDEEDEDVAMPDVVQPSIQVASEHPKVQLPLSQRRPPPSPSDSDDEVVFVGRNHLQDSKTPKPLSSIKAPDAPRPITPPPHTDDAPPTAAQSTNVISDVNLGDADMWEDVTSDEPAPVPVRKSSVGPKSRQPPRRGLRRQRRRSKSAAIAAEDEKLMEDLLDDYVENMRANGELPEEPDQVVAAVPLAAHGNGWNSDDIQDFDDMSTSEEILEAVQSILSKRERPSGTQYLVVWQGQSVDEARWIPLTSLTMPGAAPIIEAFELEEKQIAEYADEDEDSEDSDNIPIKWSSDSDDSELEEDLDDYLDEEDLIQRRIARMTDEHIARLLQKQEALGISSDDLQIFDGIELSAEEFDIEPTASSNKKRSKRRRKNHEQALINAQDALELEGDDYGDFDVMDFDRASLKQNKRAPPDILETLSDEDMAEALREAWATDRKKKRSKKLEREELRAQGLLGKKNRIKPDLKARYREGMSIDQLYDEIEDFLLNGQQEELSLPPMAKQERKVIHDVARPFGLKTKSQGGGKQRFTILYKTSRTAQLDLQDSDFSRLKRQLDRRFLPRMDAKNKGNGGKRPGDASYRDGDIVGAGASEIGVENRGRAMLERMGWSSGTALGALNNQGILKPIEHVVKNSKAGLG